jgi:uncharacterized protein (DUF983 family)
MTLTTDNRNVRTAITHSVRGHCPSCGEGKLFRAYLKQVEHCSTCNERLGHIRADDGPAWLTIMVVGHIVVTALVLALATWDAADWIFMTVFPALALAMILWFLPMAKGLFIGIIWATGAPGSETDAKPVQP